MPPSSFRQICYICGRKEPYIPWLFGKYNDWRSANSFEERYLQRFPRSEQARRETAYRIFKVEKFKLCDKCYKMVLDQQKADKAAETAALEAEEARRKIQQKEAFEKSKCEFSAFIEKPDIKEIVLNGPDEPDLKRAYRWLIDHAGCEMLVEIDNPERSSKCTIYQLPYPLCRKSKETWIFEWDITIVPADELHRSWDDKKLKFVAGLNSRWEEEKLNFVKNPVDGCVHVQIDFDGMVYALGKRKNFRGFSDGEPDHAAYYYSKVTEKKLVSHWFTLRFRVTKPSQGSLTL
jgi:hypothetical protein